MAPELAVDDDPIFWTVNLAKLSWTDPSHKPDSTRAFPEGELDTQLESLLDAVWRCESLASLEDRLEFSLRQV